MGACLSGSMGPGPATFLEGRVLNSRGEPATGASVSIVYVFEDNVPTASKMPLNPGILDLGGVVLRYEILDYTRRPIRLLVDNPTGADVRVPVWQWDDDEGNPVPNGIYYRRGLFRNGSGDEQVFEDTTMFLVVTAEGLLRHKHALTDAAGRYQVPMELFPIGEELRVTDESGQDRWDTRISPMVQVHALQAAGGDIASSRKDVYVGTRRASIHVDLTLP